MALARRSAAISPSDTTALAVPTVGFAVSVDGTYELKLEKDTAFTSHVLIAGIVYPFRVIQVRATNLPSGAACMGYFEG